MGFVSGQHLFIFLIFLAIVLIVFGPGKLPEVGSGMGKAIREFRKASSDVRDHVVNATTEAPKDVAPVAPVVPAAAPDLAPVASTETAVPVAGGATKTRVGG